MARHSFSTNMRMRMGSHILISLWLPSRVPSVGRRRSALTLLAQRGDRTSLRSTDCLGALGLVGLNDFNVLVEADTPVCVCRMRSGVQRRASRSWRRSTRTETSSHLHALTHGVDAACAGSANGTARGPNRSTVLLRAVIGRVEYARRCRGKVGP